MYCTEYLHVIPRDYGVRRYSVQICPPQVLLRMEYIVSDGAGTWTATPSGRVPGDMAVRWRRPILAGEGYRIGQRHCSHAPEWV